MDGRGVEGTREGTSLLLSLAWKIIEVGVGCRRS